MDVPPAASSPTAEADAPGASSPEAAAAPPAATDPVPGDAPSAATPRRGYSATKDQLRSRLRRIEGQVRGVDRMVDEERYCIDVLTQISAIQAALDKVALGLLDDHARTCVAHAEGEERLERTDELMAAVARMMRRG